MGAEDLSAAISSLSNRPSDSAAVTRNVTVSPVAGLRITSPGRAMAHTRTVAEAPRDIADPTGGQRWVFRRTGADTGGELLEADLFVSPGGFVREHLHPSQEETFEGVSGTFVIDVAGEPRTVGPGMRLVIPPRTPHGFKGAREEAHLLVEVRPALHLDDYFRTFLALSRDGRIRMPVSGIPRPLLQVALVMERYSPEIAAPGIPLPLQRLVWRLLGAIGRGRGLPDSFPEYGAP
jgi:quercetin dioxygenase-like cupin family protein